MVTIICTRAVITCALKIYPVQFAEELGKLV